MGGEKPWRTAPDRPAGAGKREGILRIVDIKKIWDKAQHNAFTDLIYFKEAWWCVFREAQSHLSFDGAFRVISSRDGEEWRSAALLSSPLADLRDAKIAVTPDDHLMLSGAAAFSKPAAITHRSMVWFSKDGYKWSKGIEVAEPNMWLWRTTWYNHTAYSMGYHTGEEKFIRLYKSHDGIKYDILINNLYNDGYSNETSLLFLKNGTCFCLLRRDPDTAQLGSSKPPYKKWKWRDLGIRLGGPHMICLPDGRIVAAGRMYDNNVRTSLGWLDVKQGTLEECLKLPSGGDTSYPGLFWSPPYLWVSYYSSHEENTAVYLARIAVD